MPCSELYGQRATSQCKVKPKVRNSDSGDVVMFADDGIDCSSCRQGHSCGLMSPPFSEDENNRVDAIWIAIWPVMWDGRFRNRQAELLRQE